MSANHESERNGLCIFQFTWVMQVICGYSCLLEKGRIEGERCMDDLKDEGHHFILI